MARIQPVDPTTATGDAKEMLDGVKAKLGTVPNIMATMAQSPVVLKSYLEFSGALGEGLLSAQLRERIALAVGERNECGYCVSAHTAIGKMVGLKDDEIIASRRAQAGAAKDAAALAFAADMIDKQGWVDDGNVAKLREAGFGDPEIVEIIANVALNLFTNYFNHAVGTVIDFPKAPALD